MLLVRGERDRKSNVTREKEELGEGGSHGNDTVLNGYSDTLYNLNFSRTIEGYLSYLLPKFEDLVPTSLGDIAI